MEDWAPNVWKAFGEEFQRETRTSMDLQLTVLWVGQRGKLMAKLKLWHFRRSVNQKPQHSSIAFHHFPHGTVM